MPFPGYLPFIGEFPVERFREQPFRLKELEALDILDFVLRHRQKMLVKRAQLMTSAFRSLPVSCFSVENCTPTW